MWKRGHFSDSIGHCYKRANLKLYSFSDDDDDHDDHDDDDDDDDGDDGDDHSYD